MSSIGVLVTVDEVVPADDLVALAEPATQIGVGVVDPAVEDGDGGPLAGDPAPGGVLALPHVGRADQGHAHVRLRQHTGVGQDGGDAGQLREAGHLGAGHRHRHGVDEQAQPAG
ncbi:hypothetical protein [Streptomyces sp. SPB162]|uniref:hypothetical protein n=1 Tax=Streptomyces sp. SPB162 TaxID=2940560 RepID=UPI00240598EB|nr:hypothetical protein [Streptomyces sp. SPB162]MDF9816510.1 hypothetical protein [Streptomyces sp. SPB162]